MDPIIVNPDSHTWKAVSVMLIINTAGIEINCFNPFLLFSVTSPEIKYSDPLIFCTICIHFKRGVLSSSAANASHYSSDWLIYTWVSRISTAQIHCSSYGCLVLRYTTCRLPDILVAVNCNPLWVFYSQLVPWNIFAQQCRCQGYNYYNI